MFTKSYLAVVASPASAPKPKPPRFKLRRDKTQFFPSVPNLDIMSHKDLLEVSNRQFSSKLNILCSGTRKIMIALLQQPPLPSP